MKSLKWLMLPTLIAGVSLLSVNVFAECEGPNQGALAPPDWAGECGDGNQNQNGWHGGKNNLLDEDGSCLSAIASQNAVLILDACDLLDAEDDANRYMLQAKLQKGKD